MSSEFFVSLTSPSKAPTAPPTHRQRKEPQFTRRKVQGLYDAAQPDSQAEHWRLADSLGPNAANNFSVRQTLRNRCRYEIGTNCYAKGITLTYANEVVGRGPRLQAKLKDRGLNKILERHWQNWDAASGFSEKLHVFVQSKFGDGEGQASLVTNPQIAHPVQLDIDVIEAEMLTTPTLSFQPNAVDGIVFDASGNPVAYHVLKVHPGENNWWWSGPAATDYTVIPAKNFIHWFRADRPGQARGIPEITPALGLFAQLRRWTLAVLTAAETAANYAAVLTTDGNPETNQLAPDWEEVPISMGTFVTMPPGYKLGQMTANQPGSSYEGFKRELLKEIARCLNMPFGIVAGDSSSYNYSSARLDGQSWQKTIRVIRRSFERVVMEHVFRAWMEEAAFVIPELRDMAAADVPHSWFWDSSPHVDPVKEGTGDSLSLANNTDTLANLCAENGDDWEEVLEQRGVEVKRMRELGLDIYFPDYANIKRAESMQEEVDRKEAALSPEDRAAVEKDMEDMPPDMPAAMPANARWTNGFLAGNGVHHG